MSSLSKPSPQRPDAAYIREMFDSFAERYDTFATLIGLGLTGRLRSKAIACIRPGSRVLDISCGTGNLTFPAARRAAPGGKVIGLDFSPRMIDQARSKQAAHGPGNDLLEFVVRRAEDLPMDTQPFDVITSAFALRNLYENIDSILSGILASLVPGGRIALIDLTQPRDPLRRSLYRLYFFGCVGLYGLLLFGRKYPVAYLPRSSDRFLDGKAFAELLSKKGFEDVRRRTFMLGSVTLYEARKPGGASA